MIALLLAAAALQGAPAEVPVPVCIRAEIVPGFEGWGRGSVAALKVGAYSGLMLRDAGSVAFVPPLDRAAPAGSFGGAFPLTIARMGTYRIALGAGAWIDVVDAGGRRLASAAHGHGPACSGIAKIVDFALPAGRYTVQLSAAKTPTFGAMVIAR